MIRTGGYFGLIGGGFIVFGGIAFIAMAHGFDPGGFLEDALGIALLILIVGILGILCGIRTLQVNKWKWAISGYILISLVAAWYIYGMVVNLLPIIQ